MTQNTEQNLKNKFEKKKKPDKKRVSIYVSEKLWEKVISVGEKYETPTSDAAEELMTEGLEQLKKQEKREEAP